MASGPANRPFDRAPQRYNSATASGRAAAAYRATSPPKHRLLASPKPDKAREEGDVDQVPLSRTWQAL